MKNKRVGIITHYDVHNHGAQLQMYALISYLKSMNIEAKALRFTKNYDFMELGIENKYHISLKSIPIYLKYLFKNGLKRTLFNIKKRRTLTNFRKKNELIGPYYSKAKNLDVVILGSDEIFSIEPGINPCFFGIGVPCSKIVSYAASFGPTSIEFIKNHYSEEYVECGLKRIVSISVRDKNSYDICNLYTDKPISIVCDPVILYDFRKEKLSNIHLKKPKKKYCIVYSYDDKMNDSETIISIRNFANSHNLEIFSVGYYHSWCDKNINLDPLTLFMYFENASFVFTDTFHGSVLSIISNTQFVSKISGNSHKLLFLLDEYDLRNRVVDTFEQAEEKYKETIDYSAVNIILEKKRKKSGDFLISCLLGEDE